MHTRPRESLSNYKKSADEPGDHLIGRSRRGLTTKIHALNDQRQAPAALRLTAGQAGDNPQLAPLLDAYAADKYALTYLGGVPLTYAVIHDRVRAVESRDTP